MEIKDIQPYINNGIISANSLPSAPHIKIVNYTMKCQHEKAWDPITLKCRGLIVNFDSGEVLARPFDKFFNHFEIKEPLPQGRPEVTVKLDGSLGISYKHNGKISWATRGSFISTQAKVAQDIWNEKYAHSVVPDNITLLVEIISPATRVVVNYDYQDLVLVGARDRYTGHDYCYKELSDVAAQIGLPIVQRLGLDLEQALAMVKTLNHQHEGFVLRWPDGFRIKTKSEQYFRVFHLVYGLNPQSEAKAWANGTLVDLITSVPEEFTSELKQVKERLDRTLSQELTYLHQAVADAPTENRKDFALWVQSNLPPHLRPVAFGLHDGKEDRYLPGLRRAIVEKHVYEFQS